ncbi:MAG: uroporphyrinogen decarboxylase family protein [Anaerolineae bacterium]|jgi:uroporphyrinogen decarboxylase|nr:uroporphyrinogen decarboxylase family protein [Anaerolineae bacterium]
MNSRERVLAAINHTEPDELPVDLGATPSSGISAIAYDQLLQYLPLKDKRNWVYDVVQQVAQPSDEVLDFFRIDTVDLGRTFNTSDKDWYDYELPNGSIAQQPVWFRTETQTDCSKQVRWKGEVIAAMPADAFSYDQSVFPFRDGYPKQYGANLDEAMGKIHWAALAHSPWDHASEPDFWQQLRNKAIRLRETSDRAIVLSAGCNLFEWGTFLRRIDNFLMDLVLSPDEVERFLDALMERHLSSLEKVCAAVGDVVDIVRLGDDLGMNTGPFMSTATYQKLFKPRHTKLCDFIKANSSMHTFLHSCGDIYRLIPDLIEAGFEIINPVQTNAKGMNPERLKAEFGKDMTFWGGGADTRNVLNVGTPAEVKDHVRKNVEILAPGGGFVFNTIHNILPDVPPQNVVAMFEAVDEFR